MAENLPDEALVHALQQMGMVTFDEVGRCGDLYYYAMEFVEGLSLKRLIDQAESKRIDPKRAVKIFIQVASALDHGFGMDIIHRELRPSAIMVGEGDYVKLDGLGLATGEASRFLLDDHAHYVSPEQVQGRPPDTRSDIYSLGCCLVHALSGKPPFEGSTPEGVLTCRLVETPSTPFDAIPEVSPDLAKVGRRMMALEPDMGDNPENPISRDRSDIPVLHDLKEHRAGLPDPLIGVLTKMLAPDPADRYQTPGEVANALKPLAND